MKTLQIYWHRFRIWSAERSIERMNDELYCFQRAHPSVCQAICAAIHRESETVNRSEAALKALGAA